MSRKQNKVLKPHHRRCTFEALENRRLLAGDVKVTLVGGTLKVSGDGAANGVQIAHVAGGGANAFAVTGLVQGGAATTILDSTGTALPGGFTFTTPVTKLDLDVKSGNDLVRLGDGTANFLQVNGKATIKLGKGNDALNVDHTRVTGTFKVDRGSGSDTIRYGVGNSFPAESKAKPKVPATATITGSPASPVENGVFTLNLSAVPTNKKDTVTGWDIDWDSDGITDQHVNGNPATATHQFPDDGSFVVIATATVAKKGNKNDTFKVDSNELNVEVSNAAPTVALNSVSSITENGTATLKGSFTDPGLFDAHTVTVEWDDPNNGDESVFTLPSIKLPPGSPGGTPVLANGQSYFSDDGTGTGDTTTKLTINTVNQTTGVVTYTVTHKYLDDGVSGVNPGGDNGTASDISTITVTVDDTFDSTSTGQNSVDVTVNNKVPTIGTLTVAAVTPPPVEGSAFRLSSSFTDIGLQDVHLVTVNWGDGTTSQFEVDATDPAPAGGATLSGSISPVAGSADGDLVVGTVNTTTGQVQFTIDHTYVNNGLKSVQLTVEDDDDGSATKSTTVNVTNDPPHLELTNTPAELTGPGITENSNFTLKGTFTDAGLDDAHTVTVNWGDPNNPTSSIFSLPATNTGFAGPFISTTGDGAQLTITSPVDTTTGEVQFSVTHTYRDDGLAPGDGLTLNPTNITVIVADADGGSDTKGETLNVNNSAPTVPAPSLSASSVAEGGTVSLTATSTGFTDVGILDTHIVTVNWDDGGPNSTFNLGAAGTLAGQIFNSTSGDGASLAINSVNTTTGAVTFTVSAHKFVQNGTRNITLKVQDDDSPAVTSTAAVLTVTNSDPTAVIDAVADVNENTLKTITGTFTDPGLSDTHKVDVDWDDKSTAAVPHSVFNLGQTSSLFVGQTFISGDGAVLSITSVNAAGQVGYSISGHRYADDGEAAPPNGTATGGNNTSSDQANIKITVTDPDTVLPAPVTATSLPFNIKNVDPQLTTLTAPAGQSRTNFRANGSFTDIGLLDVHTLTINWGTDPSGAPIAANNTSVFIVPATGGTTPLTNGQIIPQNAGLSTAATGSLVIDGFDLATGRVDFHVIHTYLAAGVVAAPGVTGTIKDDDGSPDSTLTTGSFSVGA